MASFLPRPPRARRSSRYWPRIPLGLVRYGPGFGVQVITFYLILVLAQIASTGQTGSVLQLQVGLVIVVLALGAAEAHLRLYRRVWLVAGLADALALALAVVEATCIVTLIDVLMPPVWRPFPSVIPVLVSPIVLSLFGVIRFLPRITSRRVNVESRLLVVIPDESAYPTVKSLHSTMAMWSVIAILTQKPIRPGQTIMGIPILGDTSELEYWIRVTKVDGVAFVHADADRKNFRGLVAICLQLEVPVFMIPTADELFRSPGASHLRQLGADDLLPSAGQDLKLELVASALGGKTVLVTGAAGSVGSELCRTLNRLNPHRIVLVDNNESGLFDLAAQLRTTSAIEIAEALVSITDRDQLLTRCSDERPDIVFHAAAYKHVPMLESHPEQAFNVNVLGTRNALWCAEAVSTRDFILVSTDKAASTESVMGCTKRLCELLVLSHGGTMRCRAVRFGNVVGSRGSVIPTFERQIQAGGPVTVTHPDMTRYMMTASQAAALVIGALLLPGGQLFMLDMGEPVKIIDMANALIRARGLRPGKDIEIIVTGMRHGERLSENLLGPDESWRPTVHPSIRQVVTPMPAEPQDLEWILERLTELVRAQNSSELTRSLRKAVWNRRPLAVDEPTIPSSTEGEIPVHESY